MGGRAAPHKPERRFLGVMRHGTKHCCAGPERPDSSKGKDELGSPCGALPANSEDDLYYIQMHHSAGGWGGGAGAPNPLSSTHMARPRPFVPSSFTVTGMVCGRAPFSTLLLHMRCIFCCRAAAAPSSHVTLEPAEEEQKWM